MTENKAFVQTFVDDELWAKAKWMGIGFFDSPSGDAPPSLGFIFQDGEAGKGIFRNWLNRLGTIDAFEELRVSIIEGDIPGKPPGYSVLISSNPQNTMRRAKLEGQPIEANLVMVMNRIHRMNPPPDSPNLANFKRAVSKQNKYTLIPVSFDQSIQPPVRPHFDLAIGKTDINFRKVSDIGTNDPDCVVLAKK